MSCEKVREQISLMLDRRLHPAQWAESQLHVDSCADCEHFYESSRLTRAGMRGMAMTAAVPVNLTARLRSMASTERIRVMADASRAAQPRDWAGSLRLYFNNMMRPFAVPVTGGLFTALLMFSLLMPNLVIRRSGGFTESPLADLTDPEGTLVGASTTRELVWLQPGDATISGNETSLVLLIDAHGKVQDFYLSGGELTDEMKTVILLSRFTPATVYGQPTWGLKQVVFQPRHRLRT